MAKRKNYEQVWKDPEGFTRLHEEGRYKGPCHVHNLDRALNKRAKESDVPAAVEEKWG